MSSRVRTKLLVPVLGTVLLFGACGGTKPASGTGGESGDGGTGGGTPTGGSAGSAPGTGGTSTGGSGGGAAGAGGSLDAAASGADSAAAMDATPPDDGAVPGLGGPPRPCKSQLCESFEGEEGAAPDPMIWTRNNDGLVLSSKRAARGTKSLHVPPMN